MISFVMDMDGMGFREALELLAQKAGVTLPERTPQDIQRSGERKQLQEVNELAAKFFRASLLQQPDAEHARTYASKRHIDDLTGDLFKIGYAPRGWDHLTKALIAKGITADELIRAGLSVKNEERGTVYDRFRDRLMFAIQDLHGNVVGFTGRALNADAKEAKYVNTPETAVYHKSSILYGLDKAKGEIKRQNLAVIVEGNMDVVSSHRVSVTNVVCTSGTALTTEQLLLLERFTKNLAIAFDADTAGIAATLRGLDLARARDFNVKIISLPPEAGKDPDDAINQDTKIWTQAIHDAADVMDWVFRASFKGRNIGKPEDKKKIAEDLLPEIRRITNPVVRDHWITKLATGLSVSPEALREALGQGETDRTLRLRSGQAGWMGRQGGQGGTQPRATSRTPVKTSQHELTHTERARDVGERILSLFIIKPDFLAETDERLADDLPQDLSTLYKTWEHAYLLSRSSGQDFTWEESSDEAKQLMDYLTIRADRDFPEQTLPTLKREYELARAQLRAMRGSAARKHLEEEMRAAELSGDTQRIVELSKEFQQLTT